MSSQDFSLGSSVDDRAYRIVAEDPETNKRRSQRQRRDDGRNPSSKSNNGHGHHSYSIVTPGAHESTASSRENSKDESSKSHHGPSFGSTINSLSNPDTHTISTTDETRIISNRHHGSNSRSRQSESHRQSKPDYDDDDIKKEAGSSRAYTYGSSNNNNRSTAPISHQNNSASVEVQAQLVQDDDDVNNNDPARNLNIALQQENERLRRELEIPTAAVQPVPKQESSSSSSSNDDCCYNMTHSCSKKTIILIVVMSLILIGAGVGAFFATQSAASQDDASSPPIIIPSSPTTAPIDLNFDPPTAADCLAVQSLNAVTGQDDLPVKTFEVELEVSLSLDMTPQTVVEALVLKAVEILVPVLVGCDDGTRRRRRRKLLMTQTSRNLNVNRYAIANAEVSGREVQSDSCEGTTEFCYIIVLELDLYLKSSTVRDFVVISLLFDDGFDGDLVDRLGLGTSVFRTITVTSIGPKTEPTAAPINDSTTTKPNNSPTRTPSTAPPSVKVEDGDDNSDTPANVPSSSCTGAEETCLFASGTIGSRSCTGAYRTCYGSQATIADDSCNNGGCTGLLGDVQTFSCNGADACPEGRDVMISQRSCNCDGCCACLTEPLTKFGSVFVPPLSCNSLAPNEDAIDYSLDRLTPSDGAATYCCTA